MTNEHVPNIAENFDQWGGSISKNMTAAWIDFAIAMVCIGKILCEYLHYLMVVSKCSSNVYSIENG